jgi:O-antigen ligase
VLIVGLGAVRSRAGVLLCGPALAFSLLLLWQARSALRQRAGLLWVAGAGGVAAVLVAVLGSAAIVERFNPSLGSEYRLIALPAIVRLAASLGAVGGGLGSFDPLYRSVEGLETLDPTFLNHAHNDYLEIWLETGWLGPLVLVVVLVWLAAASVRVWRATANPQIHLARAATIVIGLLLAHSPWSTRCAPRRWPWSSRLPAGFWSEPDARSNSVPGGAATKVPCAPLPVVSQFESSSIIRCSTAMSSAAPS